MAALEFRLLGPLEVRRDGDLVPLSAPKQRALLSLLLLRANEPVAQEELIDKLWGNEVPARARASLQNQMHALRKLLGPDLLETQASGYMLHLDPSQLDVARFERLIAEARRAPVKERAAALREALACWRGRPLAELSEPFAEPEGRRLEEEWLAALEDRIDADLQLGRDADLVPELEGLIDDHPHRERLWSQLMLALYRAGRQADALGTYRRAHHTFVGDLGIEPGVVLRELQRAILVQDPALDEDEERIGSTLERAAAILPRQARDRAESLYEYGVALLRTGDRREAKSTLQAAERSALTAQERGVAERARLYISYLEIWNDGKSPLAYLAEAEDAALLFEEQGDTDGLALSLRMQAQMLHYSGRADEALEVAQRGAELANAEEPSCRAQIALALAAGTTPVEEGIARCDDQLSAFPSTGRPPLTIWCALALLHAHAGRIDDARSLSDQALAAARDANLVLLVAAVLGVRGDAEFSAGNLAEAAHHLRAAYAIVELEHDRADTPERAAKLAVVLALRGEFAEARRLALAARATTSPDAFTIEVLWRRALAFTAADERHVDEALRLSDEARTRTTASDWLTFHGETLEEAAAIRDLAGDAEGADQRRTEALEVYERKGSVVGADRVSR